MTKRPYTPESVERALVHHSLSGDGPVRHYSPPEPGSRARWRVILRDVPNETLTLSTREAWVLCQGLAAGAAAERARLDRIR